MTKRIDLDVHYREKDEVKALGAKWDKKRRVWWVEADRDLSLFSRWLSEEVRPEMTAEESEQGGEALSAFLARCAAALARHGPGSAWVRAECAESQVNRGHLYLTLVESDNAGRQHARVRGVAFRVHDNAQFSAFIQAVGSLPQAGMKLLLEVRAELHVSYGFSLVVTGINPAFTVGELALKRQQILDQLGQEGLIRRQRDLQRPWDFFRVAVIAPPQAAGLGDFDREAQALAKAGLVTFEYFHAQFQGAPERVGPSMLEALQAVTDATETFDAVVIIRGGGSPLDLACLDVEEVARAVCLLPIPTLVGIGHERDRTILDEVAHQSFDTPSKVALHIQNTVVTHCREFDSLFNQMAQLALDRKSMAYDRALYSRQKLALAGNRALVESRQKASARWSKISDRSRSLITQGRLDIAASARSVFTGARSLLSTKLQEVDRLWRGTGETARTYLSRAGHLLDRSDGAMRHTAKSVVEQALTRVAGWIQQLKPNADTRVDQARRDIENAYRAAMSLSPDSIMARGFALVRDPSGDVVASKEAARRQHALDLTFRDGHLNVRPDDEES